MAEFSNYFMCVMRCKRLKIAVLDACCYRKLPVFSNPETQVKANGSTFMDRDEQYFKAILFHYFDTLDKMVF